MRGKEKAREECSCLTVLIGCSCVVTGNFHSHSSTRWASLTWSRCLSLCQSSFVNHYHTERERDMKTHTHSHTHFYKVQYNWNNLLRKDTPKMREIKWLVLDQALSLMQDYRLDTVTHAHNHTCTCTLIHWYVHMRSARPSLGTQRQTPELLQIQIRTHRQMCTAWTLTLNVQNSEKRVSHKVTLFGLFLYCNKHTPPPLSAEKIIPE